jgi:hypothetical protein
MISNGRFGNFQSFRNVLSPKTVFILRGPLFLRDALFQNRKLPRSKRFSSFILQNIHIITCGNIRQTDHF